MIQVRPIFPCIQKYNLHTALCHHLLRSSGAGTPAKDCVCPGISCIWLAGKELTSQGHIMMFPLQQFFHAPWCRNPQLHCRFGEAFSSSWSPLRVNLYGGCSLYLAFQKENMCSRAWHSPVMSPYWLSWNIWNACLTGLDSAANLIAWLFIIQHANATELNLSKTVESDILRENYFQGHCNTGDCFSWNRSTEAVVVVIVISTLLSGHLLFIVCIFFP